MKSAGRGSVRLECTVRDREVGGSNPPAPTHKSQGQRPDFLFSRYLMVRDREWQALSVSNDSGQL